MINYFKELLKTLKSIDANLKVIANTTTTARDGFTRCINTITNYRN